MDNKLEAIKSIKEKHVKTMIKKYSLTGMGIGFKKVNGKFTDRLSIVFIVEKKLPKDKIKPDQLLPSILEGIECDVVEMEIPKALSYATLIRPAVPGYSIGHPLVTAGTFGCVVYKGSTRYILSNNHVIANRNVATVGDSIYQPGVADGGGVADTVAYLDSWITLENYVNVDCAIAEITDDSLVSDVGVWGNSIQSYNDPSLKLPIFKSGRTTENTFGKVSHVHLTALIGYGAPLGDIWINDCFFTIYMATSGDSGSIGRSDNTNAVGLLFAGNTAVTVFSYMSNVVTALGLDLPYLRPRQTIILPSRTAIITPSHTTTIRRQG